MTNFFFNEQKWVGGNLSWYLLPGCDHDGTLPARSRLVGVGDLDES